MDTNTNIISFPGLGIGEFTVNKIAATILGHDIAWYGVIITFGMICGFLFAYLHAKDEKISTDDLLDLAITVIICGVIGARAYYVIMRHEHYNSLYSVIAIWNGGLAIYGGIIAGIISVLVFSLVKKISIAKLLDLAGPACMIGQAIGRWGNFMNAEAYGCETSLPWRMGLHKIGYIINDPAIYVHPTFLYESLWNIIGFAFICLLYRKKKFDGQNFLMYITWYGFGRMFIEGLRTDSLYIGSIRVSQAVGAITFAVGLALIVIFTIKASKIENTPAADGETEKDTEDTENGKAD